METLLEPISNDLQSVNIVTAKNILKFKNSLRIIHSSSPHEDLPTNFDYLSLRKKKQNANMLPKEAISMSSRLIKRSNIPSPFVLILAWCGFCSNAFAQSVDIYTNTEYQTIRGFGGMSGVGWINDLTANQIDTAFGNGAGQIGLSIMRMRIDPDSGKWNKQVPSAQQAISYGAILLATPWTPPAYMKSNKSLVNGGRLLPEYYSDYTDHLLKFTDYMASNGAQIYALSLQNEPDWHPDYESADWKASDFVDYLRSQGSRFGSLQVLAAESLKFDQALTNPILNDANAERHVDIMGGHLYGHAPQDYPLARSKGKEVWMTEHITNTEPANNWSSATSLATELHETMASNFNAYIWWYIRRSYGLLTEDGNVSKRGYIMSQYSKFVRPGYKRIGATEKPISNVYVTAYKGPGNKIVVVAVNTSNSHQKLDLKLHNASVGSFVKYGTSESLNLGYGGKIALSGNAASVWVDPQSVATFVSEGDGGVVEDGNVVEDVKSSTVIVRMRGTVGDERVSLQIGGSTLQTWTVGTSMKDYSFNTNAGGEIRVAFTNDSGKRDVQVDYISVNGEIRQAEDQDDNTGVWGNSTCGGGSFSEWLHCNGSIGFGSVGGSGASSSSGSSGDSSNSSTKSLNTESTGGSVTATVDINADWDGAYCANLIINNGSSSAVTWNVSVDVKGTVESLWNGNWSQNGSTLNVSGVGWNKVLQPGQSNSSVGFCASR